MQLFSFSVLVFLFCPPRHQLELEQKVLREPEGTEYSRHYRCKICSHFLSFCRGVKPLMLKCVPIEFFVWIFSTFGNNFRIEKDFTKYFKEISW